MKKLVYIFVIILFIGITAFGQDTIKKKDIFKKDFKWGIGLGAGFTTGFGISFKYHPRKNGIQLNILPYFDDYGRKQFICAGLTLSHDIWSNLNSTLFLYLANSTFIQSYPTFYGSHKYETETIDNTGIGAGLEQTASNKRISIDLMLGYAQYSIFKQMFLTGEIAVHYRFISNK